MIYLPIVEQASNNWETYHMILGFLSFHLYISIELTI